MEWLSRIFRGRPEKEAEPVAPSLSLGRNDPCWCGSGLKYKKCHLEADELKRGAEAEARQQAACSPAG